jgi:hypothetical protein
LQLFRYRKSEKLHSSRSFMAKSFIFATICTVVPACASSNYMGISLAPGAAPADVQRLAARAQSGDKQAQLELGERFEGGQGVLADRERAIRLYRMAVSDDGGTRWIYSPSPGGGALPRVVAFTKGPAQAGLLEAKEKFRILGREVSVPNDFFGSK